MSGERTGILVLDVDVKSGGAGALAELIEAHGDLRPTTEAGTGGGGRHFLFRYPAGHRIRSRAGVRPGIDVRAGFIGEDGDDHGTGQIVVHPSIHPVTGNRYEWVHAPWDGPLAETPVWLIDLLEERPAPRRFDGTDRVPAGERHDFLVREAARLRNLDYSSELIAGMLRTIVEQRCHPDPPVTDTEIDDIARWYDHKVASIHPGASQSGIGLPPTPVFPAEALPPMTRNALVRLADAQDVSLDYVGAQALVIAAAAIGTTRVIKTHTDEHLAQRPQPALLYLAVIGDPGTAKTESRFFLDGPVKGKKQEYVAEFERMTEAFAETQDAAKQRREDLAKQHKETVAVWIEAGSEGPAPEPPEGMLGAGSGKPPQPQHAWTDSATIEGIADALKLVVSRGLVVARVPQGTRVIEKSLQRR